MTETAAQQEQVRRYRRAARHRRDEAWEDVVYLHDEIGMSPTRIMRRLHIPYFVVLAILEEHYAGRRAAAAAAHVAELPEHRRATVRVEALVHASVGTARDRRRLDARRPRHPATSPPRPPGGTHATRQDHTTQRSALSQGATRAAGAAETDDAAI